MPDRSGRETPRERVLRLRAEGFTDSQISGRPRRGELSIREERTGQLSEAKKQELREMAIRQRNSGERPHFEFLPDSVLNRLDHQTRQFIFGY